MLLQITVFILSIVMTGLIVWIIASRHFQTEIKALTEENLQLKSISGVNENLVNEIKAEFSKLAQDALKNQQESLISEHSNDLKTKIELFKAEEITPINKLLKEFKESIDNYQKSHQNESLEIKNAISTAEKYAKALTLNNNVKGDFGEEWLEKIFTFANLEENIHYTKQYSKDGAKPDFVVNLPNNNSLIIDSKVILKNYIEYNETNSEDRKKAFIKDLSECVTALSKKNYEEISGLNQPGFILMYIPVEACINMIYTDYDFRKTLELANANNIIIVGTSSILVTLRLVNQLWATKTQSDNVQNIIEVGENLYNYVAQHAQNLLNIKQLISDAFSGITTEINRLTTRQNGSIFKEAEKLRQYGISTKSVKSGKRIAEKIIPDEFLQYDKSNDSTTNVETGV